MPSHYNMSNSDKNAVVAYIVNKSPDTTTTTSTKAQRDTLMRKQRKEKIKSELKKKKPPKTITIKIGTGMLPQTITKIKARREQLKKALEGKEF